MKNLKTKFTLSLLWLVISTVICNSNALGRGISGIVIDNNHKVIQNAMVTWCDYQTVTDSEGKFEIKNDFCNDLLVISKPGFGIFTLPVESFGADTPVIITLASDKVILLNAEKRGQEISEAVSYYSGKRLENISGTNRLNSFAGHLPGLLIMQRDGQPGWEDATISVRGQNTFGGAIGFLRSSPTILLDGFESDVSLLDPYDIASITVLKDAASTAMYGLRSGNGVILVNTRKGSEGPLRVHLNTQTSVARPGTFPNPLGAGTYAELYNEALQNDGLSPKYSASDIAVYNSGSDPLGYPDNDFIKDYFAESFMQTRNNLNISGGGRNVEYYFSVGHLYNSGLFKAEEGLNKYNTNTNLNVLNLHGNVSVQVSEKLNVKVDIKAKKDKRYQPGIYNASGAAYYIGQVMRTPPNVYPIFLAPDSLGGNADFSNNMYGLLNKSGYSIWERYYLSGGIDFKYDLAKGFSVIGAFNYSTFGDHIIDRSKSFAVYEFRQGASGINKLGDDTPMLNSSTLENVNRYFNTEIGLNHIASFGGSTIESKIIAERRMNEMNLMRIPHWYKGLKGRIDYSLNDTYFASLAFSYQGSEQFPKGDRFGFFPAASLGWIVMNDESMFLKLRTSAGLTGNDFDSFTSPAYFAFMERYIQEGNVHFGTDVATPGIILRKVAEENSGITWSKTLKYDVGFDLSVLNRKVSLSADYFFERSNDILVAGSPGLLGISYLYPRGIVDNGGVEGMITWAHQVGPDFNLILSANGTYAKSNVVDQNEETYQYEWQYRTGHPVGSRFGYVFDRFFTETDNFSALPDQSALGRVMPGSLKYKDLNGDNIIDERDVTYLGIGGFPEIWYGLSGGFDYKGIDFNIHFSGAANRTIMYSGDYAFAMNNNAGTVNEWHLDRWQPGDGQNATYPGLSIFNFSNNMVPSSFWIDNGNFIRLQAVQFGYTLPKEFVKKFGLENLRLFVNGSNLMTWSNVKGIDPSGGQSFNGTSYPVSPTCTGGFNLSF